MRVVIAGSRDLTNYHMVEEAVRLSGFTITTVISGTAGGVDQLGELWAQRNGVPVERFPAEWKRYGRSAGYRRNEAMVAAAAQAPEGGAVIAVWNCASRGTKHTIDIARKRGVALFILHVPPGAAAPTRASRATHVQALSRNEGPSRPTNTPSYKP